MNTANASHAWPDSTPLSTPLSTPITTPVYTLYPGTRPLLVSLPHVGTLIPEALKPQLVTRALATEDTDWHLEALYNFATAWAPA